MGHITKIDDIERVVITLKSIKLISSNRWTLDVDPKLNKAQIRHLVESTFGVHVISVNTHIPPRSYRSPGRGGGSFPKFKRAIVTLKKGERLSQ